MSLIELILTMTIVSILAAMAAPIFSQGIRVSTITQENLFSVEKLGYGMERLLREIREINHNGGSRDILSMSATAITFIKNDNLSTQVTINYDGLGKLFLSHTNPIVTPTVTATLTDEVDDFALQYFDVNGIITSNPDMVHSIAITLALVNPITQALFTQRSRVVLRDLA